MRASEPVTIGHVDRDGIRVHYEVFGSGAPTVFLLMPDTIVDARAWKAQVPFLARRWRTVVADPRGNGRSGLPGDPSGWTDRQRMDDVWAILDTLDADEVVLVGVCTGAGHALRMAGDRPERVAGVVAINPGLRLSPPHPWRGLPPRFEADLVHGVAATTGWDRENRQYWQADWRGFAEFFFDQLFPEPHSTKQREDGVEWACGTTAEAMLCEHDAPTDPDDDPRDVCRRVACPVLVIAGTDDRCQPPERGRIVADLTGGDLVLIDGGGHLPMARDPVRINLLLREFVERVSWASRSSRNEVPGGTTSLDP